MCTQLPPYHTSQSPQGRGLLATLRNRRPSARFAFGCMVGCGVAFVRRYLVPGASTWQPLQIWSRSAPLCICGNHSTSLPHPTTRPWNIVRHKKHSTQLCSIPPNTKYITLPLKCAAFNPSNNSGQGKGKFQVNRLIQYSNFDTGVSALSSLV